MTLFEQLRERYTDYDAALTEQTTLLTRAAGNLTAGLGGYLGLPTPRWHNDDGRAGDKYVRLGTGSVEDFQEIQWQMLSGLDGVVSFLVALTVDSPEAYRERFTFVFDFDLKFCDDGYLFQIKHVGDVVIKTSDAAEGKFEPVYNAMLEKLHDSLDPSKILIRK